MNEVVEEPDKRNSLMAANPVSNPEFSKYYEQKRKDEKNTLFQTFVDDLEEIIAGISQRRSGERTFNNSIGKEVKIIDFSDIKILQLIQASLKFNVENINMIVSFSEYFDLLFVISHNKGYFQDFPMEFKHSLLIQGPDGDLFVNSKDLESLHKGNFKLTKLVEKDRLVSLLHSCVHNGACFVDDSKVFRKAYCGAVNEVGKMITNLHADKRQSFTDSKIKINRLSLGRILRIPETNY